MASTTSAMPTKDTTFDSDSDGQARGGRRQLQQVSGGLPPLPTSSGLSQPAGQLLRGAVDDQGKNTKAALMVGIKLDLEAEIHLTARVRGDIAIGLY
ncbi:hypothetical protein PG984_008899 [Apiospora sp. TS-2023a]|uniref:Uncharacterized protein n=1 Tax=Apiospora saccharicola TaxID=335842 RepID=A0ABR1UMK0_9PEZI